MGFSLKDVEEKVGISRKYISKYENGISKPRYHTLIVLADFYNCSVDYLLGKTDIRYPPEKLVEIENDRQLHFLLYEVAENDDLKELIVQASKLPPEKLRTVIELVAHLRS